MKQAHIMLAGLLVAGVLFAPVTVLAQDASPPAGEPAEMQPPEMLDQAAGKDEGPPHDGTAWGKFKYWVSRVWRFEAVHVGDKSVEVSQFVVALLTLLIGLWLARRITHFIRARLLLRFRVDHSAAAAIEKIFFYVLVVVVVLMALQVVAIPLTIFTFLGGAVAIGIGFGTQNIFNNFISGLILMLERPVRLGDLVEVEGDELGRVMEIRYRCTRIRRNDGIDVLVPNSKLLEQNVTNWTFADRQIRTTVSVGVAYGSDTGKVRELLQQAVDEHDGVLRDPPPTIIFEEFGDNALVFDLYFWGEIRSVMELRIIRSDLRFRIDALFREAGITISFPQRDIHMDTLRPLEVRLIDGREGNGE